MASITIKKRLSQKGSLFFIIEVVGDGDKYFCLEALLSAAFDVYLRYV